MTQNSRIRKRSKFLWILCFLYNYLMELLSELDWRWDVPDDLWMECYLRASWDHRHMIHEIMKKHCLTTREAVQKLYKCDEESALHDTLPWDWNTPVIQRLRERSTSYYRTWIWWPRRCDSHRTSAVWCCYSYTRTSREISRMTEGYTGWRCTPAKDIVFVEKSGEWI